MNSTPQQSKDFCSLLYRAQKGAFQSVEKLTIEGLCEISLYDYNFPFNSTLPICEFNSLKEMIQHLQTQYTTFCKHGVISPADPPKLSILKKALCKPPRMVEAGDIIVKHKHSADGIHYSLRLLLPKLSTTQATLFQETILNDQRFSLLPSDCSDEFSMVILQHLGEGDIIELEAMLMKHGEDSYE